VKEKLYIDRGFVTVSPMQGSRVLILSGDFQGSEGICLGEQRNGRWAISPDERDEIVPLLFEREFALLIDLSADPVRN
jgi:hypothetical protein